MFVKLNLKLLFLFSVLISFCKPKKQLYNANDCDLFVTPQGNDLNSCTSYDEACLTLSNANDLAIDGNTICLDGSEIETGGVLVIEKELKIITLYEDKTILNGGNRGCFYFYDLMKNFTMEGFRITNCSSLNNGATFTIDSCTKSTTPLLKLRNLVIEGNTANTGAGLYLYECDVSLENVTIKNNYAGVFGGGLYCSPNSAIIAKNVLIVNNTAGNEPQNIKVVDDPSECIINSQDDLKDCDECYNGGSCNFATGNCDCLPGSSLPSPECEICLEGFFSESINKASCEPCSSGTYNDLKDQTKCTKCRVGTFNPNNGSRAIGDCVDCETGSYQDLEGQSTCTLCPLGQYNNLTGTTQCTKCSKGMYNPHMGSKSIEDCLKCMNGTFQDKEGQSSCVSCPKGSYQDLEEQTSCNLCGEGMYQEVKGQSFCLNCIAGTYQDKEGQSICVSCHKGTYQDLKGQHFCCMCGKGTYQDEEGQSTCLECKVGTYQDQKGQSICGGCDKGTYQDLKGQQFCNICGNGTYQDEEGQSSCFECQAGTYQDQHGQSICNICPMGTYQNRISQEQCVACPRGTYNSKLGSGSIDDCIQCGLGTYNDQTGQSNCYLCPAGQYSNQKGSLNCLDCQPGRYSIQTGQTQCDYCEAGTYQDRSQSIHCEVCGFDTYQPNIGSNYCNNCPVFSETLSTKTKFITKCYCKIGYYGENGDNCKSCPDNGVCDTFNQHHPMPLSGFWTSQEDPDTIIQCTNYEACPGLETNKCNTGKGYTGDQCSSCLFGYYKFEDRCLSCPNNNNLRLIFVFLGVLFFIIFLLIIAKKMKNYFGSLSILISFLQIIAIFPKFSVAFPYRLLKYFSNLSFFNFNLDYLALDCSIEIRYPWRWFVVQLLPVFNLLLLIIIYYLIVFHSKMVRLYGKYVINVFPTLCVKPNRNNQNIFVFPFSIIRFYFAKFFIQSWSKKELKKFKNNCINVFLASLFLLYLILCLIIFQLFNCKYTKESKEYLLVADPTYHCYDTWWYRMLIFAILFGILYILGIPLFFVWIFWHSAKRTTEKIFMQRFGLLCSRYKEEWFFWELIIMARKILLVICQCFLYKYPIVQLICAILVVCASIVIQYIYNPYNTKTRNTYEFNLLLVILFILFSGLVLNNQNDTAHNPIIDFIIFLLFSSIFLFLIISILEIKNRIEFKKHESKIKKNNRFLESIQITKQDPIIRFLQMKPNLLHLLRYFSEITHSHQKKTFKFFNSLNSFLNNNQKFKSHCIKKLKYDPQIKNVYRSMLSNTWKNDLGIVVMKWYHFKADNISKFRFNQLLHKVLLYEMKIEKKTEK
ncbi:insulin-like growth factor binding protein [Anaeramoeba flamelloides]|uniref:Insulin-like growth factor binding protein n=1 Tax=Anaeramoeba flamelloides TaxID=1746091 RepID=A0ABQ8Y8G0_9EUKA|nr:insulin-like growth factor binding protein [Anaeramoeba flamelloides]